MTDQQNPAPKPAVVQAEKHETKIRWLLAVVAVLVLAGTVLLLCIERTTSDVTVTPLGAYATSSAATHTDTTTTSPASDTLILGFLGLSALLLLTAVFYGRITKLVLPGGVELDFNALVAAAAKTKPKPVPAQPAKAGEVSASLSASSETGRLATLVAAANAAQLVQLLSRATPSERLAVASAFGVSEGEIEYIVQNASPSEALWDRLRALAADQMRAVRSDSAPPSK